MGSVYAATVDAIYAYTGLSLTAFVTILALMAGMYHLVSSMFVSPEDDRVAAGAAAGAARNVNPFTVAAAAAQVVVKEPVQLGDVTIEELRAYDGSDPEKPLLMAIKGRIFDVSRSRMFYGPGGPYSLFAGRDASRALALMSFDPIDLTSNLEGLSTAELEALQDWEEKFNEKYVQVGCVVSEKPILEDKAEGDQQTQVEAKDINE